MSGYAGQVREYLDYCRKAARELKLRGSELNPKYHPTADGCAKQVPHGGDTEKARKIRQAFRDATEPPASEAGAA